MIPLTQFLQQPMEVVVELAHRLVGRINEIMRVKGLKQWLMQIQEMLFFNMHMQSMGSAKTWQSCTFANFLVWVGFWGAGKSGLYIPFSRISLFMGDR